MSVFSTSKLSSKGQIVIPEEIRQSMGFQTGDQFFVIAEKDVVILKSITKPDMASYSDLIKKTKKAAKQAGLTKANLNAIIKEERHA